MKNLAVLVTLMATFTTSVSAKDSYTAVDTFEDLVAGGSADNVVCATIKSELRERGLELLTTQLKMTAPQAQLDTRISSVAKMKSGKLDTRISQEVEGSYREKGLNIRVLERDGETCLAL